MRADSLSLTHCVHWQRGGAPPTACHDTFLSATPLPFPPPVGAGQRLCPEAAPLGGRAGARLLLWLRFFPKRKVPNYRIAALISVGAHMAQGAPPVVLGPHRRCGPLLLAAPDPSQSPLRRAAFSQDPPPPHASPPFSAPPSCLSALQSLSLPLSLSPSPPLPSPHPLQSPP